MCGEHVYLARHVGHQPGSSPRVRGTLIPFERGHEKEGIIPACAGNT
ncbi:hypothetical protein BIFANG_03350 [Bifidobacterium angulatum DSM 20098 = JCM 7096]|nr:hypothetical protein BIFANG_03350 [Bifidobacterium angulatum DSM 20098 = JCM 7096]